MVTAIWSDDPELYNVVLGGDELVKQVFLKINYTDASKIIERFNLSPASEGVFTRSDEYKYICVTMEDTKTAIEKMKETLEVV